MMEFTRLYLIRHGQVVGHDTPTYNGHTDVGLTPLGKAQLDAVVEDLANIELSAVYSSDLKRAMYGGKALAQSKDLPLRVEPLFKEMNFGAWEAMTFEEVQEKFPGNMEQRMADIVNYKIPEGETISDLWDRVGKGMDTLLENHKNEHIALFAHSGVNRVILLRALGCPQEMIWRMDQHYGCLNIIDYFGDGFTIVRLANGPNRATLAHNTA
jgi:alpha-ribazole phosphatase